MHDAQLFPGMEAQATPERGEANPESFSAVPPPRLRRANRAQALMQTVFLEDLLPTEHPARLISAVVAKLDLAKFYDPIKARGDQPGRPATDPAMLISLWLYAATVNIGCGRELARRCESQDAFRWICGGVPLCYKVITDFRVGHAAALDDLFTQVLVALVQGGVVSVEQISQDGSRVRASAGGSSFHRKVTTEKLLAAAQAHVEKLRQQLDPAVAAAESARVRAAQERGALEKVERLTRTLAEVDKIQKGREVWARNKNREIAARSSSTDPEARLMKMAGGGMRPAYNVQLASDPGSRAVVGVAVTNQGTDNHQDAPMREQVRTRLVSRAGAAGTTIKEQLLDGGYSGIEDVNQAAAEGVTLVVPPREREAGPDVDPVTGVKPNDTPDVAAWRERMATEDSKEKYTKRCSTSETINGDLKTYRGLSPFTVRGLPRVTCAVLWSALAYNIMQVGDRLLTLIAPGGS
jgi:transposase